jgi:hypothetical protein
VDETAIYAIVVADAGVQAVLGTTPMRFYDQKVDETVGSPATTPYAIATVVVRSPENTLDASQAGGDSYRIQFSVFAATKAQGRPVENALRNALGPHGYEISTQEFVDPNTDLRMTAMDWEFWLLR